MQVRVIQALTSVHVGEGNSVGSVDLPIARERHTGWPVIPGASIKGTMRQRASWAGIEQEQILRAFGPEPESDDEAAGEIRFGQATLLALPIRALKGTFVLATSPLALGRMARVAPEGAPDSLPNPSREQAIISPQASEIVHEEGGLKLDSSFMGSLLLEDLSWIAMADELVRAWSQWLAGWTGDQAPMDRLVVLHDDIFTFATRYWTEVRTRASIDPKTHVVVDGQLFSVESLPPETLMWMLLEPDDHAHLLPAPDQSWVLGGNRTVGMGRVCWYGKEST